MHRKIYTDNTYMDGICFQIFKLNSNQKSYDGKRYPQDTLDRGPTYTTDNNNDDGLLETDLSFYTGDATDFDEDADEDDWRRDSETFEDKNSNKKSSKDSRKKRKRKKNKKSGKKSNEKVEETPAKEDNSDSKVRYFSQLDIISMKRIQELILGNTW